MARAISLLRCSVEPSNDIIFGYDHDSKVKQAPSLKSTPEVTREAQTYNLKLASYKFGLAQANLRRGYQKLSRMTNTSGK